jgi:hypothetical protein
MAAGWVARASAGEPMLYHDEGVRACAHALNQPKTRIAHVQAGIALHK